MAETAAAPQQPQGYDSPGIIGAIDKILAPEPPPQQQAQNQQQPPEQAPAEGQEAPAEGQPEGEPEAAPNKQVEGEEAQAADAPAGDEISLEQLDAIEHEITIKGEDGKDVVEKPTTKELKLGYMRQRDYHRKTEDLARQRSKLGEESRQAVEAERTKHMQELQVLHDALIATVSPELKDVNWNHLAANDAFEYVRLRNRADQFVGALQKVQQAMAETKAKSTAAQKEASDKARSEAREKIAASIPNYNDALHAQLVEYGKGLGFKAEEIDNWADPRATQLLYRAFSADQKKPAPPAPTKKVAVPSKALKPGASNAGQQARTAQADAMQRLNKSGRVEDAAAVIKARLGL